MKKNFIVKLLLLFFFTGSFLASCKSKGEAGETGKSQQKKQQYTCPMHPEIIRDQPGKCPICGMDLVPKEVTGQRGGLDTGLSELVKPVNEQVVARTTTIEPESGIRIFSVEVQGTVNYDTRRQTGIASRVGGRIERLNVKYNYQPIRKGQLLMEIYSPDLAAAQRELLYLSRSGGNEALLQKAKQRLSLLGMQPGQIQQVLRTGAILYRVPVYSSVSGYILEQSLANQPSPASAAPPSSGTANAGGGGMAGMGGGAGAPMDNSASSSASATSTPSQNSPVLTREGQYVSAGQTLFTVYNGQSLVAEFALTPDLAAQVKRGQNLLFRTVADPNTFFTGSIGLIQPTFRAGTNFTIARVYTQDSRLKVGQLITANVPIVSRGWWVPASAVLQLGTRSVVFKKEGNVFKPKEIRRGVTMEGMVQIIEGVSGWEIAKNAAYLVDSESFIRLSANNQTEEP